MDDEEQAPPPREYPVSPVRLSKTPSWIMLGFVLGALFVAALPPLRKAAPADAPVRIEFTRPPAPRTAQPLATIEAVFAEWGGHAIWSGDTTEVALWNSEEKAFSDLYEVRRYGDTCYFRSIPALTRRVVSHGKPMPDSPLRFTETEEQYREWREHGRTERPVEPGLQPVRPPAAPPKVEPTGPSKASFPPDPPNP